MASVTGFSKTYIPGPYAEAASPARPALERGDWKAAESLTGVRLRPQRASDHLFCSRARSRPGRRSRSAKPDIAMLGDLRDKLREVKDAYWSEQVDIQTRIASAWLLYAEGKKGEALKAMSDAADARIAPRSIR